LKANQQKLVDAGQELRQLDKEIQNIHVIVGEEDTADQDFVDAYNMGQIDKILKSLFGCL